MNSRRRRFLNWVCRKISLPEGHIMPKWLLYIAYLLHPSRAIMDLNPWFKVNYERDTFTYHGVEMSFRLLDCFSETTESGYALIITRGKDNIMLIKKVRLVGGDDVLQSNCK